MATEIPRDTDQLDYHDKDQHGQGGEQSNGTLARCLIGEKARTRNSGTKPNSTHMRICLGASTALS